MILRFHHGWGFDASLWQDLSALLPGCRSEYCDRGYFGEMAQPGAGGEPVIAVTHSFGTMLALSEPIAGSLGLVAINGFDCFTARQDFAGVSPRILDRMVARFATDPGTVLASFRKHCGDGTAFGTPHVERLRADLVALRDQDCRAEAAAFGRPILSLHGAADAILPPAMRQEVFTGARLVDYVEHPDAGHLLPLTAPGFCAARITDFLDQLQ